MNSVRHVELKICQTISSKCQSKGVWPTSHPLSETSWLVRDTSTFSFIKIHAGNNQIAQRSRCEVQSFKLKDTRKYVIDTEYKKWKSYYVARLNSTYVITYRCVVSHADMLVNILPLYINRTQHFGHTDDSRSGVKMFLRVVILVFAATCCTARVIGKSLHTRHWYIRSANEAVLKQAVTSWHTDNSPWR